MEKPASSVTRNPGGDPSSQSTARLVSRMALGSRVRQFFASPRLLINSAMLLAFAAAWIREFLFWIPTDAFGTSLNYWAFTDWLIDYSQGFIRRGLSGEIWRLVPASVSPIAFVAIFSWILILAIACGYMRLLARSLKTYHPLTLFGMLFLPSLFFFYLHDHQAIARKEILGYATVLLHLWVIEIAFPREGGSALPNGSLRRYALGMLPVAALLLPAIILIHEGNFLLFIPFHAMMTLSVLRLQASRGFAQAAFRTALLYLPAALALTAVYLAGTPSHSMLLGICEKWAAVGAIREGTCILPPEKLSGSTLPGSFIPMEWSLERAAHIVRFIIGTNWGSWLWILPALGAAMWYLARQAVYSILHSRAPQFFSRPEALRYTAVGFGKYFLIPLLAALPVFFTAYDYGRWFTVVCINFILLVASADLPWREFARRSKAFDITSPVADSQEQPDHPAIFYGASIGICLLALATWLPHYCLFSCEIIRSPLLILSHSLFAH